MTRDRIGFTGTRSGMTATQLLVLHRLLQWCGTRELHHGDCQGADAEAHDAARALGYYIVSHPPESDGARAHKMADETRLPRPFLVRNRDIVEETQRMIATPAQTTEQWRGSGTWSTIREARKRARPLLIIFPDGSLSS